MAQPLIREDSLDPELFAAILSAILVMEDAVRSN